MAFDEIQQVYKVDAAHTHMTLDQYIFTLPSCHPTPNKKDQPRQLWTFLP